MNNYIMALIYNLIKSDKDLSYDFYLGMPIKKIYFSVEY